ncbi:MAG: ribosome maturation factor RimM [Thermoanaerobaculia bacterium]
MKSSSSTTEGGTPPLPNESILVGIVLRPHGVRGELTVASQTDNEGRFAPGAVLEWAPPGRPVVRHLTIERSSPYKGGYRIAFAGVADRDAAEALRGGELSVPRAAVPEAEEGAYYFFELVGCRCHDEKAGELGTVVEVLADGGGWLLEVEERGAAGVRRLSLPFVEEFLVRVDRADRRIDWRLPEGLIEACASRS